MRTMKNDVAVSFSMMTEEQIKDIQYFASRYGMTMPAFLRFAVMKLIEDELKPAVADLNSTQPPAKEESEYLEARKEVADARESGNVPRVVEPHSDVSRDMPCFARNTPTA